MGKKGPNKDVLGSLAICKKDQSGRVLSQNEACLKACGVKEGQICTGNCMERYKQENPGNSEGTFQFKNMKIDHEDYDVIMVNDGDQILTLLFSLAERNSNQLEFFRQFDLTPREEEILACVIKKMSNKGIANTLCISEKTLKTHINNILKKVPRKHWPRK